MKGCCLAAMDELYAIDLVYHGGGVELSLTETEENIKKGLENVEAVAEKLPS